jgi:fibronectin type 3 domain-containing protein
MGDRKDAHADGGKYQTLHRFKTAAHTRGSFVSRTVADINSVEPRPDKSRGARTPFTPGELTMPRQDARAKKTCTFESLEQRTLPTAALPNAGAVSMAYDYAGTLHVAYYDAAAQDLKYTTCDPNGTWGAVTTVDAAPGTGAQLSLAIDSFGGTGIAYYDAVNGDLKYAHLDVNSWAVSTVDSKGDVGAHPSLAYHYAQPLISYFAASTGRLKMASLAKKWSMKNISPAGGGPFSSVAVNPNTGKWAIAYESPAKHQLKIMQSGGTKVIATLPAVQNWGSQPSLGFDTQGVLNVAYGDPASASLLLSRPLPRKPTLKYWSQSVIASNIGGGVADTALVYDRQRGRTTITYATGSGNLNFAAPVAGGGWSSVALGTGQCASTALDPLDGSVAAMAGGDVVILDPALLPATGLSLAQTQATEVDLAWTDNSSDETGFDIQRATDGGAFQSIALVGAGVTSYADATVFAGNHYDYRIYAVHGSVDATLPATASIDTVTAPLAPTNLSVTESATTKIDLAWTDNATDESGYRVARSVNGGAFTLLASLAANATAYSDTTATLGNTYAYRVYAVRGSLASSLATGSITVAALPVAPTNLFLGQVSTTEVDLSWTDNSADETGFRIERSVAGAPFALLTTVAANVTTYADTTVTAGTAYDYRVYAVRGALLSTFVDTWITVAATAPSTPANLAATGVSDTEINLTWDRTGTGESSITIWRSTVGGPWGVLTKLPAGSNIFTDTSCYPSTSYAYRVTADNGAGSSPPTVSANASTLASAATQPIATGFAATAASPFTINLSWNDPATGFRNWLLERSSDGGMSYSIIAVVAGSGTTAAYTDTPLSPATTYYYRVRLTNGLGYSDYTVPVAATTAARVVNTPLEATGLTATVNSATSTTLHWTDHNAGAASYLIETAPFSWTGTPTWTQVAQTAVGDTSYNLTTTAETFYYVRIRAQSAAGDSGYTPQVVIRSASPGTGSPKIYTIGPGQQYASLAALDWTKLGPGDTVYIYPNKNASGTVIPYYEKPLISVRGTAAAPINIVGVADPVSGQLPIIDATNAVTAAQWASHYLPLADLSLVLIGTRAPQNTTSIAWSPGYFSLQNLDIRNAYQGDPGTTLTYIASDGSTRSYSAPCGIYVEKGDHITIKGCTIHGNNEGIFGAGQGDQRNLESVTIDSNSIYGNGTINGSREHNTYIEGLNTVYQFNKYGLLRNGSLGGGLKDRGAGTIVRYNWLQGGGHLIDIVESQNYASVELTLASYEQAYVYGNIFYNGAGGATTPIHYGGDGGVLSWYRKGILHFYGNSFINQMDQSQLFRINVFNLASAGESLDARNNIVAFLPATSGQPTPELDLLPTNGTAYFGRDWVSASWHLARPDQDFAGHATGTANFISNALNDPGFADAAADDFDLTSLSQCVDQVDVLSADEPTPVFQYADPASGRARPVNGSALDLGAFEQGV